MRNILRGSTSVSQEVFFRDPANTSKVAGLTGLTSNTAGLTWTWNGEGGPTNAVSVTVTGNPTNWASGTFAAVDATKKPGSYVFHLPNVSLSSTFRAVVHTIRAGTNTDDVSLEILLDPMSGIATNAAQAAVELPPRSRVMARGTIVSHSGASVRVSGIVSEVPNCFQNMTLVIPDTANVLDYTAVSILSNGDSSGTNSNNLLMTLGHDLSGVMVLDTQPVYVLSDLNLSPTTSNGPNALIVHVTDTNSANLAGALVSFTGAMLPTPQGTADSNGLISSFGLNNGTYRAAAALGGYLTYNGTVTVSGTNFLAASPATIAGSGTTITMTVPLTAVYVAPATNAGQVNGSLYTYDAQGAILGSVNVEFEMVSYSGATSGASFPRSGFTGTSNASTGLLTEAFEQTAKYRGRRIDSGTNGAWVSFNTPTNNTTFSIPLILGKASG